jgi:hypothetical protein
MADLHTYTTLPSLCLALMLGLPALASQADGQSDVVGEVTSVIGLGKVFNTQGEQTVTRGQLIRVGDRIETPAGGHVHLRFVDGGLVSVRPLSRLHIEDYRNSNVQNLAAIKFRLDVGVMRSVTGQWGEAHRDRFRLNTPVAAIGIKGTDFVVKTEDGSTLASVKTGAIVMSPLEGSCAAGLGPCAGERSALLTADMRGQMLEYLKQNDGSAPRLVPHVDLLARNNDAPPTAQVRQVETGVPGEITHKELDNQAKEAVTAGGGLPAKPALTWLHNTLDWNVPTHTISTRFDEASAAGRRAVVGNFFINLYRDETTKKDFSPPSLVANFNLTNASANYTSNWGRPTEVVSISGATLSVDFARNTLATQMNLASPSLGQETFAATATVNPEGIFASHTATQQIAGAFSNDAGQAGYLFEKRLPDGTVSGLTLWGR